MSQRLWWDEDQLPYYELVCDGCDAAFTCYDDSCYDWALLRDAALCAGWDTRCDRPDGPHHCPTCHHAARSCAEIEARPGPVTTAGARPAARTSAAEGAAMNEPADSPGPGRIFGWWAMASFTVLAAAVGVLAPVLAGSNTALPAATGVMQRSLLGLWLALVATARLGGALALPAPRRARRANGPVAALLAVTAVTVLRTPTMSPHAAAVVAAAAVLVAALLDLATAVVTSGWCDVLVVRAGAWLAAAPLLVAAYPTGDHGPGGLLLAPALLVAPAEGVLAAKALRVTDQPPAEAPPASEPRLLQTRRDDLDLAS